MLIKFCQREHNIQLGAKLRVGTLFGYRSIENSEIQDDGEGKYEFTIEFPEEITLDRRWINLLFQRLIGFDTTDDIPRFPGSISAEIKSLHIVRQTADSVTIKDTTVKIHRSVNNCLIFCMSVFDNPDKNPFKNYSDHWSISEHNANEFSRRLGNLIFQQAKLALFDSSVSDTHSPASISRLALSVRHRRVAYQDRHMQITEERKPAYEELMDALTDIPFFKPERFRPENEYRFMFELTDGQKLFPPKQNELFLTLNPFADL